MKVTGNREWVWRHEIDAAVAEASLEKYGILPALLAYLAGISRHYR